MHIRFKPHLYEVLNAIQMGFLQMRLSLTALDAQNGFQIVLYVTYNMTDTADMSCGVEEKTIYLRSAFAAFCFGSVSKNRAVNYHTPASLPWQPMLIAQRYLNTQI